MGLFLERKPANRSTAVTEDANSGLAVPSDSSRAAGAPGDVLSFGPFRLFPTARVIGKDGVLLALGSRALDILIVLVEFAGQVVSHRELISRAWRGLVVDPGNLRVHISGLRKALGDTDETPKYIANVLGQ